MNKVLFIGPKFGFQAANDILDGLVEVIYVNPHIDDLSCEIVDSIGIIDASMKVPINEQLILKSKKFKIISCATTGSDHIDSLVIEKFGITLKTLKEDKDQLKSSYNELLAKTYREAAQRKLKQRQAEKTSNKDKANRPKPTEIIGFICSFANVIISNIAIGNKKIEALVDDTITIIESATTKQDIEKAKLFRNNALMIIAANKKRLTTVQQVIDVLNLLAPLITPIIIFFKTNPIPSAVPPGVGVPLGTITTIDDKTRKLQNIIDSSLSIVSVLSSVVSKLIDDLDYQESRLNQVGNILEQNLDNLSISDLNDLLLSSSQGLGYLSGYDYKGFRFFIKEENNPNFVVKGNKRRYATAVNKDGNDVLQSSSSFTLEPDVLVEELKLQIDQKGLVA